MLHVVDSCIIYIAYILIAHDFFSRYRSDDCTRECLAQNRVSVQARASVWTAVIFFLGNVQLARVFFCGSVGPCSVVELSGIVVVRLDIGVVRIGIVEIVGAVCPSIH